MKRNGGCGLNEISIINRATENSILKNKIRQIMKVSSSILKEIIDRQRRIWKQRLHEQAGQAILYKNALIT